MNRIGWGGTVLGVALFVLFAMPAKAQEYHARLSGFEEIGGLGAGETGAINSPGQATLHLTLDKTAQTLSYTLTYSGLANVLQSHIHLGKEHVAGGIMVFFCSNLANPPSGTPTCPADSGTVTGTITAAGVVGPTPQGVTVGDFAAVIAALASDTAYANIHTMVYPAGEIRGQIHGARHEHRGPENSRQDHDQNRGGDHNH